MDEQTLLALFDRFEKSTAVELKYSSGDGASFLLRRKEAFAAIASGQAPTPAQAASAAVTVSAHEPPHTASPAPHAPIATGSSGADSGPSVGAGNEVIKSPIVGTFYRSASPDAPPFAEIGKRIAKGQKLCIIEAMKMMNALEAEIDCEIVRILVDNGAMVEFDQPLFEVRNLGKAASV